MRKKIQSPLFCNKCSVQFGNSLAKFNTNFAFNLHLSTLHRKEIKSTPNKGQKRIKCERCGRNFSSKSILNVHVASVHEGKKPFKCHFSPEHQTWQNMLIRFMKKKCKIGS